MARSKPLSWGTLAARIKRNCVEAAQVAGELLEMRLKELVGIACPEYNEGNGGHSPMGGPPYKESGEGQESIAFHRTRQGFEIGVRPTNNNRLTDYGRNQLIYWDQNGRPWISNWQETLGDQFNADFATALKRKRRKR